MIHTNHSLNCFTQGKCCSDLQDTSLKVQKNQHIFCYYLVYSVKYFGVKGST